MQKKKEPTAKHAVGSLEVVYLQKQKESKEHRKSLFFFSSVDKYAQHKNSNETNEILPLLHGGS